VKELSRSPNLGRSHRDASQEKMAVIGRFSDFDDIYTAFLNQSC
jgi:hypothetical protein